MFVSDGKEHTVNNDNLYVSPQDQEGAGYYDGLSVIRVEKDGTSLTVNSSTVSGGGVYVGKGAVLTIDGSTIKDGQYYEKNDDGTVTPSGGTELDADGGIINVSNSTINSTIVAENGGTITLNNTNLSIGQYSDDGSIVADSGSTINLNSGTYDATGMDFIGAMKVKGAEDKTGGKINLIGGRLVADNLRAQTDGSLITSDAGEEDNSEIVKGGIVLKDSGIIKTQTGEIFDKSAANKAKDSGAVTNDYISYQGGVIEFTDSEYTIGYLVKANENMNTASSGKTSIAMLGKLVNDDGSAVGSITVDQAAGIGNAKLDTVTVKASGSDDVHTLTINGNSGETDGVKNANSFNAAVLDLNGTIKTVNVEQNKQLGLGGSQGGELVQNAKDNKLAVNVDNATLNISRDGVEADVASNLTADIKAQNGATVNSVGGNNTIKGDVTVDNATLNVKGNSILTLDGKLTSKNNSEIIIGNADKDNPDNNSAGTLIANKDVELNGATVFLDPVWHNGDDISKGSKVAFANLPKVDGKIGVGTNSVLSLGTADTTKAEKAFAKTGEVWGDKGILSAVYVEGSYDVSNGSLIAGPTITKENTNNAQNGRVRFDAQSILMVDGTKVMGESKAALTNVNNLTFDGKLYIDNADKGTYHILSKQNDGTFSGSIKEEQILSNIDLLKFESSDGKGDVKASYKDADTVYNGSNSLVIDDVVNKTLQSDKITSGNAAYDFFRKAIDGNVNDTTAAQANAINSSANLGALGGVNHAAYSASNLMTDSVTDHLSLASHEYNSSDIWAKYIHSKEDIDGMELGGLDADYDASFDGITVGGDFYNKGKGTLGAAFSYAKGDIDGYTLSSRTQNDADYYGLSLYGRIDNGDSAVLGDISYMHGSNDVKQYNSDTEITASPDSDAFSIGVRAEKLFKAGENGKVVPYAGLRYMHLGTGDYTNSLGMSYDASDQNLWLIPVGVKFTTEIKHNDWTISPYAEAGYVWTAGDRETDQSVSLNGGINAFSFETADKSSFIGKLGVQAESDTMLYGLGYEYQNGDTVSADKWMANVTFKF